MPLDDDNIIACWTGIRPETGMNILSYAGAMRNWTLENMKKTRFEDAKQVSTAGSMNIAQVIYDGEVENTACGPLRIALAVQCQNRRPGEVLDQGDRLADQLFDSPVLYMTGHESFT